MCIIYNIIYIILYIIRLIYTLSRNSRNNSLQGNPMIMLTTNTNYNKICFFSLFRNI